MSTLAARICAAALIAGTGLGEDRAVAQTTPGASPGVVWMGARGPARERPASEVGLAFVEVVVTDGRDRPVTGLPAEAFHLEEDGVRQRVVTFRAVDRPGAPDAGAARRALRRVSTNAPGFEASPTRVFVIVFDDLHLGPAGAVQARRVCERFIEEHTRPDDQVILVAPGESLVRTVVTPGGAAALAPYAGSLRGRREGAPILTDDEAFRIVEKSDTTVEKRVLERAPTTSVSSVRSEARQVLERARHRRQRLLSALTAVLEVLAAERTRKSVLLVSEGFIHDPRDRLAYEVIAASQRANAAVSFLDVRGLAGGHRAVSRGESTGTEILATITGGQAIRNVADLEGDALARLSLEASHHYLLGYLPSSGRRGDRLRKIRVDVERPGARVRSRRAVWDPPDSGRRPDREASTALDDSLRQVLVSSSLLHQIPLRLTALALAPTDDGRVEVAITSETSARALSLEPTPDGSRGATLDVVVAVSHVQPQASRIVATETLTVRVPESARGKEAWLPFRRRLFLPPGRSLVKVAVRDRGSGVIGTVVHPLEVPEPDRLRVSSPILSDVPEGEGVGPPRIVARRSFAPGSVLYCYFEVFPGPGSAASEAPGALAAYEVVDRRGKVRIRSALPLPVRGGSGGLGRLVEVPLARIEPGEYELVLDLPDGTAAGRATLREPFSVTRPPRFDDALYHSALNAYLEGDFRRAVATVLPWPPGDVGAAARRLSRNGHRLGETALMLHTDLALVLRRHGLEKNARDHFSIGRSLLEEAAFPDLRREWLLALAYEHQSRSRTAEALALYTECARAFPEAGEARLGAGTLHERTAFFPAALGRGNLNLPPRRAARAAERSYRDALRVEPSLTEARLRLGRVLQLTDRADEAGAELSLVVESARDPALIALAHLFRGEISESRRDVDGALAHYRAALAADPSLQVAALALARVLHERDGRGAAVDALVPALGKERGTSPWLAYRRGPLRLSASPLQGMRSRLRSAAGGAR